MGRRVRHLLLSITCTVMGCASAPGYRVDVYHHAPATTARAPGAIQLFADDDRPACDYEIVAGVRAHPRGNPPDRFMAGLRQTAAEYGGDGVMSVQPEAGTVGAVYGVVTADIYRCR